MLKASEYIWEWPVRIYHWLNVGLISVLFATGIYIGHPFFTASGEPYYHFLMGKSHAIHTLAAWIFIANLIFRFYWAFAGNKYAHFRPWEKGFFYDLKETLKYYMFLKKEHSIHVGHNAVAQIMYFLFMWVGSFFMVLTGLALQGEISSVSFQNRFFGWMIPLLGNSFNVRSYHHLAAWLFLIFVIGHLYMVLRQDILDDDATVSSMINGHKFLLAEKEHHNKK